LLLQCLALLPEGFELRLPRVQTAICLAVLRLKACGFLALLRNRLALGVSRVLVARRLRLPLLQAPLDALGLGFHLLQRRASVAASLSPSLRSSPRVSCATSALPSRG